jgi:imidazolonepropionase-like amidohydrolase
VRNSYNAFIGAPERSGKDHFVSRIECRHHSVVNCLFGAHRNWGFVYFLIESVNAPKFFTNYGLWFIHSIEHGMFLDDEVIELMLDRGTYLVPTLLAPLAVIEAAAVSGAMPEYGIRKARETIEIHNKSITKAYEAGVKIAMGTDAGVMPHGTNLRELGLMCGIGMSPMESLVATTKVAAECMGWGDRLGTLTPGKLADVVVAGVDPLADVRTLEDVDNIKLVMKDGQVLKDTITTNGE